MQSVVVAMTLVTRREVVESIDLHGCRVGLICVVAHSPAGDDARTAQDETDGTGGGARMPHGVVRLAWRSRVFANQNRVVRVSL